MEGDVLVTAAIFIDVTWKQWPYVYQLINLLNVRVNVSGGR